MHRTFNLTVHNEEKNNRNTVQKTQQELDNSKINKTQGEEELNDK